MTARFDEWLADLLAAAGGTLDADHPVSALVTDRRTTAGLRVAAEMYARSADDDVRVGASISGWWAERAAHPGSSAVIPLVEASATKYAIGVAPDEESEVIWRRWLGVESGIAGMHSWRTALDGDTRLIGLSTVHSDDQWLWQHTMSELAQGRSWATQEKLGLAALRLRTRCDAAELWESALLSDRYWRRRAVHTGHVCTGTVSTGAAEAAGRFTVVADRLDTRLKAGTAVVGWVGSPTDMRDSTFRGEVKTVSVDSKVGLALVVSARRRGILPSAGERVTVMPEPTNPSVQFAARTAIRTRYRLGQSWVGQEVTPTPQRREVPLDVLVAAADCSDERHQQ